MKRRDFVLAGGLSALTGTAWAESRHVKLGVLGPAADRAAALYLEPFLNRLGELGYREGSSMLLDYRTADNRPELIPKVMRELAERSPDLIFIWGPEAPARALRDASVRIPVVFIAIDYDPVERGIVASLRRPGGSFTGTWVPQGALVVKRFDIMREAVPTARRFLVFVDKFSADQVGALRKAAQLVHAELTVIEFMTQPYDFAGALEAGRKAKVDAFIGLASPLFAANRGPMAKMFASHHLPAIGSFAPTAEAGFLMSYSASVAGVARQAAEIAARVLKGARPADIPVEQANEFELVINLKTAKALAIKIPQAVMVRATRVIE